MILPMISGPGDVTCITRRIKSRPLCKPLQHQENDKYLKYYKVHFKIHEERFYGHIQDINIILNENDYRLSRHHLPNIKDIGNYHHFQIVDLNNFGCCFLSKSKATGEDVIVKHIVNSYSKNQTRLILKDTKKRVLRNSKYLERLINRIVIQQNDYQSIWYVFEYCPTLGLDVVMKLLHETILGYSISQESEYVSLLYSYNSFIDKSKESFPDFMNIVKCISSQLLCGIAYLHGKATVHRYINPYNLRLSINGILKITDLGVTKRFQWLHYNSRSLVESGVGIDCTEYKDPIKRIKLGGNFYYLEPHLRVPYLNDMEMSKLFSCFNDVTYHMDYFSCSMVMFELLFGFTYGDIDLYRTFSFYEQFKKFDLIFFFPDYYLNIARGLPNIKLAVREFRKFKLSNLKSFVINHGDGFLDFIIEGLRSDTSRWSRFFMSSANGQSLDISNLTREIIFFREIDFINPISNIPVDFHTLLMDYSKKINLIDYHADMENLPRFEDNLISPDTLSLELNTNSNFYQDSKTFYIPEFSSQRPVKFRDNINNSSKLSKHYLQLFQHKPHKISRRKTFHFENNIDDEDVENVSLESSSRIDNEIVSKNNKKETLEDQLIHKKYSGVFVHEFFNNLEKRRKFNKSLERQRKIVTKDISSSGSQHKSKKKMPICNSSSSNNDFLLDRKLNINRRVGRNCSHHSKYLMLSNQDLRHRRYRKLTQYLKDKYFSEKAYLKRYITNNSDKGISADLPYLSDYELRQYQNYSRCSIPQAYDKSNYSGPYDVRSVSCNTQTTFNDKMKKIKNKDNFEIEQVYSINLNNPSEPFRVPNNSLLTNITSSYSTKLPENVILQNEDVLIRENQMHMTSEFQNSVIKEIQTKIFSNNYTNYLETKSDTGSLNSSKYIYLESANSNKEALESPFIKNNDLENCKKTNLTTKNKEKEHFRKREHSPINTKEHHQEVNRKRINLKDSSVLDLFWKPSDLEKELLEKHNLKRKHDVVVQTYSADLPATDYSSLLHNSAKKFARPLNYPTNSVLSLVSVECQTQDNDTVVLKDSDIQCSSIGTFSKNAEVQTLPEETEISDQTDQSGTNQELTREINIQEDCNDVYLEEESITLINEIEILNSNLDFCEESFKLNKRSTLTQNEPICCNESELVWQSHGFVEHFSEASDRTIELFKGLPLKDHTLLSLSPEMKIKPLRKCVNFRLPISDIFDSEYVKVNPQNTTFSNPKGILKGGYEHTFDKSENTSPTNSNKIPYLLRPKVNSRHLEIMDEWQEHHARSVKDYLNRDFDLVNLEKRCFVPNLDADGSLLSVDSISQDCHPGGESQI